MAVFCGRETCQAGLLDVGYKNVTFPPDGQSFDCVSECRDPISAEKYGGFWCGLQATEIQN